MRNRSARVAEMVNSTPRELTSDPRRDRAALGGHDYRVPRVSVPGGFNQRFAHRVLLPNEAVG
ncbi:hypothetical protein NJB14194_32980 [Mycobacterium montefiorense]|uniref:Uncharacterized protein n=1 Tax=Mycobacterium montefiorense TaxID=154654 RepID=A0AA37UYG5_9MYCO|nr:hypothetical protein NJB14194_32980 [Mycobacterium montefiorense]GKU63714.1 hypothetical protein NJB18182_42140 [Mycobacterium montefiorense]GKU64930.1 hypothetical protein NJB18183_00830 [Mycobacterium montefiorense]GKU74436.1 hypothetical protein NJB18185_42070 [Mycobacterium montefiorense]